MPTKQEYLTELISSVGIFVANLRWRAFHFLNPSNTNRKQTFGFKTTEPAPSVAELKDFENDMYDLVKCVKFKQNVPSTLQNTLKRNMQDMKEENRMYVAADKTNNYYKVTKERHEEMMMQNVTKDYKKCDETVLDKVNQEDKEIAKNLDLDNRIYAFSKREITRNAGLLILPKVS